MLSYLRLLAPAALVLIWITCGIGQAWAASETPNPAPTPQPSARLAVSPDAARAWAAARAPERLRRRLTLSVELGPAWSSRNEAAIPGDTGTRFDVDDPTGSGPTAYGRVTLDWRLSARHALRFLVAPLHVEGSGTLDEPVSFRGKDFAAGLETKASYTFNSYRLGYRYLLAENRSWSLHVGATLKIRDAQIRLRQGSTVGTRSDLGFVALLHADVEWRPRPGWRVTADLDGLAAPQGRAFDFALTLHRDLNQSVAVGVGYRLLEGGADNDDVYTFSMFHQVFVSLTYRL